jgi:hypothetical protein
MKTSRFIAGLSAAIIAASMTAAIPASADQNSVWENGYSYNADYDLIDVVNAFSDAGFDAQNVQNLRNFLILNGEYFDGNDYKVMIDTANEIKVLYIRPLSIDKLGKEPDKMTQKDRYFIYDLLQPAAKDAIMKKFEKVAKNFYITTTWDVLTVKTDTTSKDYPLWYGTLDVTKAVRKADYRQVSTNVVNKAASTSTIKMSNCEITLAGNKISYQYGKKRAPKVTVLYKGQRLVKGRDYTLSFKDIVNGGLVQMGKVAIEVKGTGDFSGKKTVYFYVVPEKPTFNVTKDSDGHVVVKINADNYALNEDINKNAANSGYQIQFCTNNSFKAPYVTTFVTKNMKITNLDFNNLITGKQNVRVRAFIKIDGVRRYSAWSVVKTTV